MKRLRLHLGRIEDELRDVQRHFPAINAVLNCRRDDFSDTVRQNMLTAYEFLDAVVGDDLDLFSDEGLEALLQLNHLVLLGKGYDPRVFGRHITATRRQFFDTSVDMYSRSAFGIASRRRRPRIRSRRKSTRAGSAHHNSIKRAIVAPGP